MTVLDEFVIQLKLDPKQFDQAQKDAFDRLREFEKGSEGASRHVTEAMRDGMDAFYRTFTQGLGKTDAGVDRVRRGVGSFFREFRTDTGRAHTGLNLVGDQSRRTGEQIYAGGVTGAAGFKHLTSSLLEAYGIVGTLEGAMHKLEQSSDRATSTIMGSLTTGIKPRELGALAGMYLPASFDEVKNAIQTIQSWKADWEMGKFPQQIADAFSRYGGAVGFSVNYAELGSARKMLEQISEIERRLPVKQRLPFLRQLGISENMLPEMLKNPEQQQRDYLASHRRQPTGAVSEELFNLRIEVQKTEQSWTTMWETIAAAAGKAGVMRDLKLLNSGLQEVDHWFTETTNGSNTLKVAFEAISGTISLRLLGQIIDLVKWLAKLADQWARLHGLGAFLDKIEGVPRWMLGKGEGLYNAVQGNSTVQKYEGITSRWFRNLLGLDETPPVAGGTFRAKPGAPIAGATPLEQAQLNEVRSRESSGNYGVQHPFIPGTSQPDLSMSASGGYGIIDSTWKLASQATGLGTQYQHAWQAPPEIQDANALWLDRTYGPNSSMTWKASGVDRGSPYPTALGDAGSTIPGMRLTPTPATGLGSSAVPPSAPAPASGPETTPQPDQTSWRSMIASGWQSLVKKAQDAGIISPDPDAPPASTTAAGTSSPTPAGAPLSQPPRLPAPAAAPAVPAVPAVPAASVTQPQPQPTKAGPITGLPATFHRGGIVPAAAGGWHVPASFGTDTVPAMLTPGEMVLPRALTDFVAASARIAAIRPQMMSREAAGGTTISIGNIAVQTAATDAQGIAQGIRRAVEREMTQRISIRVMRANTIYE